MATKKYDSKMYKSFVYKLHIALLATFALGVFFYAIILKNIFPQKVSTNIFLIAGVFLFYLIICFIVQVRICQKWSREKKIHLGKSLTINVFIFTLLDGVSLIVLFLMNLSWYETIYLRLPLVPIMVLFNVSVYVFLFSIIVKPIYKKNVDPTLHLSFGYALIPTALFISIFGMSMIRGFHYNVERKYTDEYFDMRNNAYAVDFSEKFSSNIENVISAGKNLSEIVKMIGDKTIIGDYNRIIPDYINSINFKEYEYVYSCSVYVDNGAILGRTEYQGTSVNTIWNFNNININSQTFGEDMPIPRAAFNTIVEAQRPYVELKYNTADQSLIYVYCPIVYQNRVEGIITFILGKNFVTDIMEYVNIPKIMDILFVDNAGKLNYSVKEETYLGLLETNLIEDPYWKRIIDNIDVFRQKGIVMANAVPYANEELLGIKTYLDNIGISMVFSWNPKEENNDFVFTQAAIPSFYIVLITVIVLFSVISIIISQLNKPIILAAKASSILAKSGGDLTKRLLIQSNDEAGMLSHELNEFLDRISIVINALKFNTHNLTSNVAKMRTAISDSYKEIDNSVNEFEKEVASINKISSSITTATKVSSMQRMQFISVNNSIQGLLDTVSTVNSHMEQQAIAINETSASIHQMMANISSVAQNAHRVNVFSKNLVSEAQEGSDIGEEVVEAIHHIRDASVQITDITNVIQTIAEQTNLLAMNAAIEAAHAGEQGKGFAIVADKIRKLAEDTGENSKIITEVVQEVTDSIEHTVGLAIRSNDSIERILESAKSVANLINEITNANSELDVGRRDILEVIKNLNQITRIVQGLAEQQTTLSGTVNTQIASVDRLAEDVSRTVEITSKESKELLGSVEEVSKMSHVNRENIGVLEKDIEKIQGIFSNIYRLVNIFKTDFDESHQYGIDEKNEIELDIEKEEKTLEKEKNIYGTDENKKQNLFEIPTTFVKKIKNKFAKKKK